MVTPLSAPVTTTGTHCSRGYGEEVARYHRTVLRSLNWPGGDCGCSLRTLGITSCYSGEGVSTVAAQLAVTAASYDRRVLLVDCSLERPSAERTFRLRLGAGLADYLLEDQELPACIQTTGVENLSVLTAGRSNGRLADAYDAAGLVHLVESLKKEFHLSVFDMPAAGEASPTTRMARLLDGVVLVVEAERVRLEVAQRITEQFVRADVRLLGAVLNKRQHYVPNWLYRTL